MVRIRFAVAMLMLALGAAAGAVTAQGPSSTPAAVDLGVNVVSARDLGCSDDDNGWTSGTADLRVRVLLGASEVLATAKAQDHSEPVFAHGAAIGQVAAPATLTVIVEEAEPGAFFGSPTYWVECDTGPGPERRHTFQWTGGTQEVVARGQDADAAEVRLVVGPGMPGPPAIGSVLATTQDALIDWDPGSVAASAQVKRGLDPFRQPDHVVDKTSGSHLVEGLLDDTAYEVRLVAVQDPWLVASGPVAFRTANAPPPPFPIAEVRRTAADSYKVTVSGNVPHDAQRWDVHAGPTADLAIDAGTYRGLGDSRSDRRFLMQGTSPAITLQEGDLFVKVVTVDFGGLHASSAAAAIPDWVPPSASVSPSPSSSSSTSASSSSASTSAVAPASTSSSTGALPPSDEAELERTPSDDRASASVSSQPPRRNLATADDAADVTQPAPLPGAWLALGSLGLAAIVLRRRL